MLLLKCSGVKSQDTCYLVPRGDRGSGRTEVIVTKLGGEVYGCLLNISACLPVYNSKLREVKALKNQVYETELGGSVEWVGSTGLVVLSLRYHSRDQGSRRSLGEPQMEKVCSR